MFLGQIILNYSKTYRISLANKDGLSLALTVSKSEGESLLIIGFIYARGLHIDMKCLEKSNLTPRLLILSLSFLSEKMFLKRNEKSVSTKMQ